jgi:hypothetical protein
MTAGVCLVCVCMLSSGMWRREVWKLFTRLSPDMCVNIWIYIASHPGMYQISLNMCQKSNDESAGLWIIIDHGSLIISYKPNDLIDVDTPWRWTKHVSLTLGRHVSQTVSPRLWSIVAGWPGGLYTPTDGDPSACAVQCSSAVDFELYPPKLRATTWWHSPWLFMFYLISWALHMKASGAVKWLHVGGQVIRGVGSGMGARPDLYVLNPSANRTLVIPIKYDTWIIKGKAISVTDRGGP